MTKAPWFAVIAPAMAALAWTWPAPAHAQPADPDELEACVRGSEGCTLSFPPPPPTGVFRPFSLTFAGGAGALFGPGERDVALSHNLVRVGWGMAPNLSVYASFEGARAPAIHPVTHASSWLRQDTLSVGLQLHFWRRAYVRGGGGVAWVAEDVGDTTYDGGRGMAAIAAFGFDVVQLSRTAVSLELATTAARYHTEWWESAGLNLALSLF